MGMFQCKSCKKVVETRCMPKVCPDCKGEATMAKMEVAADKSCGCGCGSKKK